MFTSHAPRAGVAAVVALLASTCVSLASSAPAEADVPITTQCVTSTVGTTISLTANCATTEALTIPNGFTLNGGGFTITANNPPAAHTYTGAVVTNAAGATSMNIENLTITGPAGGFPFPLPAPSCNSPLPGLFGIYFNDASGSVNNVDVLNMFQANTGPNSPACQVGHAIRADGVTAPRTVTITDTAVSGYQKAGMFASGSMTMNISSSVIGPPSAVPFSISQNGVQWTNTSPQAPGVGASGTMTGSTINGSSFGSTGPANPAGGVSVAVLLFGANNVTVDQNTITGSSDVGILVAAASANSIISFNAINRPTPPSPDSFGTGVDVAPELVEATRLICNTFTGWVTDIEPAEEVQEPCPPPPTTTTTVPAGVAGTTVPGVVAPTTTTIPEEEVSTFAELPATGFDRTVSTYIGFALIAVGTLIALTAARRRLSR